MASINLCNNAYCSCICFFVWLLNMHDYRNYLIVHVNSFEFSNHINITKTNSEINIAEKMKKKFVLMISSKVYFWACRPIQGKVEVTKLKFQNNDSFPNLIFTGIFFSYSHHI